MRKINDSKKPLITIILLIIVIGLAFVLPKPEYKSLNILSELDIPTRFADWRSVDVSDKLNLNDDRYNFISQVFARLYQNRRGDQILFLILDAGNFHDPKVCFTAAGYLVRELDSPEFQTQAGSFNANALHMKKDNSIVNLYYWLCLDKKIVGWYGQKVIELWSSLLNKKKAGLMVRLEIPAGGKTDEQCLEFGRGFIQALDENLSLEQKHYLFGK